MTSHDTEPPPALSPHDPVGVVVNPSAGSAGDSPLPRRVVTVELGEGDDLPELLNGLADRGCVAIGSLGGDGSVGCAAGVAIARGRVLWTPPGGTLNHFARSLGLDDVPAAIDALEGGHVRRIDAGEVDGTVFVNNASLGIYGEMVHRRERLQHRLRLPKWPALALAAVRTLPRARQIEVAIDGRQMRVFLLFVGNNRYTGSLALGERERLDEGLLDVMVLRSVGRAPRLGVLWELVTGRLPRSRRLLRWAAPTLRVHMADETVLAFDGEVERALPGRVEFRSLAGELAVVTPG